MHIILYYTVSYYIILHYIISICIIQIQLLCFPNFCFIKHNYILVFQKNILVSKKLAVVSE